MTVRPTESSARRSRCSETDRVHPRLLKCTLEPDGARAWWQHEPVDDAVTRAFEEFWFGAKSVARIAVLVANFRARFDAYPEALEVLRAWPQMDPRVRTLVCHWHVQLSDPLYRSFTGVFLPARRDSHRPEITRDVGVGWVGDHAPSRWTMATRIGFASKLLSTAHGAGLVSGIRDPRPLVAPRVPDTALAYLMYLLRGVDFAGTLVENPYAASVGLDRASLEERLRALPELRFGRQGDLVDFGWRYPNLRDWAQANVADAGRTA